MNPILNLQSVDPRKFPEFRRYATEQIGSMVAAWIALEDIAAHAGRFFVGAGSHKIDMGLQSWANNIADHHEDYIQSVVAIMRDKGLEIRAPKLVQGDVLLWNARTIHGSLDSQDAKRTRQSVTLHAISAAHRFLQLQSRIVPLRISEVNGVRVQRPKDMASARARALMFFEVHFPGLYYALKQLAVRAVVASKGLRRGSTTKANRRRRT